MDAQQLAQKLNYVVNASIGFLVQSNFISEVDAGKGWFPRYDMSDRLEAIGFAAGCTLDDANRPTLAYNFNRTPEELLWGCPHEAVHLCQLLKGDWDPQQGFSFWKGERFDFLAHDDPNYYHNQPWESEAAQHEGAIREHIEQCVAWYRESNEKHRALIGNA